MDLYGDGKFHSLRTRMVTLFRSVIIGFLLLASPALAQNDSVTMRDYIDARFDPVNKNLEEIKEELKGVRADIQSLLDKLFYAIITLAISAVGVSFGFGRKLGGLITAIEGLQKNVADLQKHIDRSPPQPPGPAPDFEPPQDNLVPFRNLGQERIL